MSKDVKNCSTGLDARSMDFNVEIRQKRGDTLARTLRRTYAPEFAAGVRGDTRFDTLRDRTDGASLSQLLKNKKTV
jgi:hypothetical protein